MNIGEARPKPEICWWSSEPSAKAPEGPMSFPERSSSCAAVNGYIIAVVDDGS